MQIVLRLTEQSYMTIRCDMLVEYGEYFFSFLCPFP